MERKNIIYKKKNVFSIFQHIYLKYLYLTTQYSKPIKVKCQLNILFRFRDPRNRTT